MHSRSEVYKIRHQMCIVDHQSRVTSKADKGDLSTSSPSTSPSPPSTSSHSTSPPATASPSPTSVAIIMPQTRPQQQKKKHHNHHHHHDAASELMDSLRLPSNDSRTTTTMKDAEGGDHTMPISSFKYAVLGCAASALTTFFSLYFPFWLGSPEAAARTYHLARFDYTVEKHHFDNTVWTYGTDYGLAAVMLFWCATMLWQPTSLRRQTVLSIQQVQLTRHIWNLLGGYSVSTLAGALSHQFYSTLELRCTWHFRILWTICVGTVAFASSSMGSIGSEMVRHFQHHTPGQSLPFIPKVFWQSYGVMTTLFATFGWFSYQRPACDIFIAGITQFPSSFYIIWILAKVGHESPHILRSSHMYIGMLSFIANAPLLPLYPILVQNTSWTLANVNTFLHSWLLISWSMQGFALRHVLRAVLTLQARPTKAVPILLSQKKKV